MSKLGLLNKSDKDIWEVARHENFIIVSFDSDFYDLSITLGQPPKLIWIRSGNLTTKNLERILNDKADQILAFGNDPEAGCLEVND